MDIIGKINEDLLFSTIIIIITGIAVLGTIINLIIKIWKAKNAIKYIRDNNLQHIRRINIDISNMANCRKDKKEKGR